MYKQRRIQYILAPSGAGKTRLLKTIGADETTSLFGPVFLDLDSQPEIAAVYSRIDGIARDRSVTQWWRNVDCLATKDRMMVEAARRLRARLDLSHLGRRIVVLGAETIVADFMDDVAMVLLDADTLTAHQEARRNTQPWAPTFTRSENVELLRYLIEEARQREIRTFSNFQDAMAWLRSSTVGPARRRFALP